MNIFIRIFLWSMRNKISKITRIFEKFSLEYYIIYLVSMLLPKNKKHISIIYSHHYRQIMSYQRKEATF